MIPWQQAPFFRPALAAIVGVLYWRGSGFSPWLVFGIGVGTLFILTIIHVYSNGHSKYGLGILAGVFMLYGGVILIHDHHTLEKNQSSNKLYYGEVSEVLPTKKFQRFIFKVRKAVNQGFAEKACGKVMVLYPADQVVGIKEGNLCFVSGKLQEIPSSGNPAAFNYKNYLENQGIFYQCFAEKVSIAKGKSSAFSLKSAFKNIRLACSELINQAISDSLVSGMVHAMVLGEREHLPEKTKLSFQNTGAVHVLAVSGLHVGIVASFVMFFFHFLNRGKKIVRFMAFLLSTMAVWFFVFLSGGGPSVMRAGLMFTLFIFNFYCSGYRNAYNFLAFALLVMLAFDPYSLYSVGFQFSFLALLGILTFYKKFQGLMPISNLFLTRYFVGLIAVSLAAQLMVGPLSIYYFHQFPTYFWLSSLWAIPWTFVTVLVGILFLIVSFIAPGTLFVFQNILESSAKILYRGVSLVEELPFGLIENIWWSSEEVLLIYGCTILFGIYWQLRNQGAFLLFLAGVFAFFVINLYEKNKEIRQSGLIVYNVRKGTLIDFYQGEKLWTYRSDALPEKTESFAADNFRSKKELYLKSNLVLAHEFRRKEIIFRDRIVIIGNQVVYLPGKTPSSYRGKVHTLILTGENSLEIGNLIKRFQPIRIVLDNSIPRNTKRQWSEELKQKKIGYWDIYESGAFWLEH